MNRTFLIIHIAIMLFSLPAVSSRAEVDQSQELVFENTGADGNGPEGFVTYITQDHYGFMWFATMKGLFKYDGYDFTHFKYKPNDPKGIGSRMIQYLHEDRDGVIWLGMMNSLDRFDRGTREFSHYRTRILRSPNVEYSGIGAICDSNVLPGTLWLSTANGLERFDKRTGKFTIDSVYNAYTVKYPRRTVSCLEEDENGILWLGTLHGLHKYDVREGSIEVFRGDTFASGNISHNNVVSILRSPGETGVLWVGTADGLNRYDPVANRFTVYRNDPADPESLSHNFVLRIARSRIFENILWIGTGNGGLNKLDTKTGKFYRYRKNPGKPGSLGTDFVNVVYENSSGVLWVGSLLGKLYRTNVMGRRFVPYHLPAEPRHVTDPIVTAIFETPTYPNTVWLGTFNGLQRFQRDSCVFTPFRKETERMVAEYIAGGAGRKGKLRSKPGKKKRSAGISGNIVIDIKECLMERGKLWIATMDGGLNKFDPVSGKWINYLHEKGNTGSISSNQVLSIYQAPDRPEEVWVGTQDGVLNRLTINGNRFIKYIIHPTNTRLPASIMVMRKLKSQPDFLWIGTLFRGVVRFNIDNRHVVRFRDLKDTGKYNDSIFALHESPITPGFLWLGGENGLLKIDTRSGKFRDFPGRHDVEGFQVSNIMEDDAGNLWLNTAAGMVKFTIKTGRLKQFDIRDGLLSNETSRAAWKSANGEMFCGTHNGFNSFFPSKIRENPFKPPVVITDFHLFNRPVKVGEKGKSGKPLLTRAITDTREICLTYEEKMFSFRFAALNYVLTEKNRYAYKMDGFDGDWNYVDNNRTAFYTGLPHGRYTFRVKGSNNDGVWNENETSIRLIISPPWWKTGWAYALYALLGILLLAVFFRIHRVKVLHKEREQTRLREAELRAKAAEAQAQALEAENRRKVSELEEARKLQLSMLPKTVPEQGELDIGVYMKTATEVGGDYYDFYTARDGSLTVAVGDATGHGLKAGTMVSIMKGVFLAEADSLPADLERFFTKSTHTIKQMKLGNLFMALTLLRVKNRQGVIASAGMPPLFLYRGGSGEVEEFIQKAPPIGAFDNFSYHHQNIRLCEGDTMLLLSDGLPELFNGESEMFGYKRIKELIKRIGRESPHLIIQTLVKAGEEWLAGKPQDDDITFVVLKVK